MDDANDANDATNDASRPPGRKRKRRRARYAARLDGDVLVVSREAALPPVCLKCGTHDGVTHRETDFQWTPLWSRLLIFCAIGLLTRLLTREYATLGVPLCAPCTRRWNEGRAVTYGAVGAFVLAVVFVRTREHPRSFAFVMPLTVAAVAAAFLLYVRPRTLQVDRIDDAELRLKGFDAAAAREIVEKSAKPRAEPRAASTDQ